MQLSNLKQAPFNCTMMGVMRGALDYYAIAASDGMLYGASGHAFVLNIHEQLCPSGPYCWNTREVHGLLANVGLRVENLGFFWNESGGQERSAAEAKLRAALEVGVPCALVNMENQLITGCDDTGFLTSQPWECNDFPPAHLTFGTWDELGDGIHMDLCVLHRCDPADPHEAVVESLCYAVDLWRNPKVHTREPYSMGPDAYAAWSASVQAGQGGGHGNWWNAMVWAECRARAADYFREIAALLPDAATAESLAVEYAAIADLLTRCSDKELDAARKVSMLAEAAGRESACIEQMERALAAMV